MKKTLFLTLKRQWFDMIASGEKREEYREIKPYWAMRFLFNGQDIEPVVYEEMVCDMKEPFRRHSGPDELMKYFEVSFWKFDQIVFRNGYAKNCPSITVDLNEIVIATGRPDWGAEPYKYYFTLRLGEVHKATSKKNFSFRDFSGAKVIPA